jgi:hypothetical protein
LVIIYIIFTQSKGSSGGGSDSSTSQDNFNDKGWIVFIRPGCTWCHKQVEELKSTPFKYVECTQDGKRPNDHHKSGTPVSAPSNMPCSSITGFPTWYNTKTSKTVSGFKTIEQLNAL